MKTVAAGLGILACAFAAPVWVYAWPFIGTARLELGLGLVAGPLLAGWLIERWRHKPVLVAGLVLLGAALSGLQSAPDAWMRPLMGVLGLGAGMTLLAASALGWASGAASPAAALNRLHMLLPVGVILFLPLGLPNLGRLAVPLAAVAVAAALWTRMPPRAPVPPEPVAPGAARRPAIARLALLLFLYALSEAAIWSLLVPLMSAAHVLARETSWQMLCYGVPLGLIAGRACSARLLANVPPPGVVRVASLAMAFSTALLLLARSPSASWIAVLLVGAAMAPVLPTVLAMAAASLPRWPAAGMGMALAAAWLGLAASTPLVLWGASSPRLVAAMWLLPVASLAMAAVAPPKRAE